MGCSNWKNQRTIMLIKPNQYQTFLHLISPPKEQEFLKLSLNALIYTAVKSLLLPSPLSPRFPNKMPKNQCQSSILAGNCSTNQIN
jgi:hypothetical protein